MVINEPNLFVGDVHDRMPVVLEQKDFDAGRKGRVEEATALMKPAAENILKRSGIAAGWKIVAPAIFQFSTVRI
jgi:putative SOS response-associated peptidase YedK